VRLETERLVLRVPESSDLDGYAAMFGDPEVARYTSGRVRNREETVEAIERMRRHWDDYGVGLFSVVRTEDRRLVGRVGYLAWDTTRWAHGLRENVTPSYEIELGWTLAREFWGRGYATEAAAAARDHAFAELALPRLFSLIARPNAASIRVAERLGERLEQRDVPGPFPHPTDLYAISA
jgi:RimJ/RimL family protein N-acetyltransferase